VLGIKDDLAPFADAVLNRIGAQVDIFFQAAVTTGASQAISALMQGSSSTLLPALRVVPNVAIFRFVRSNSLTRRKNSSSFGLLSGKPPSR
jgi:hypothetical protein